MPPIDPGWLAFGRQLASGAMPDTVRISRPGPADFDRATGGTAAGVPHVFYEGPGRLKVAEIGSLETQSGEGQVGLAQYRLSVPFAAAFGDGRRPEAGDVVDVLTSADPRMAGRCLWVVRFQYSSTATALRYIVEDRVEGKRR